MTKQHPAITETVTSLIPACRRIFALRTGPHPKPIPLRCLLRCGCCGRFVTDDGPQLSDKLADLGSVQPGRARPLVDGMPGNLIGGFWPAR